MPEFAPDYTQIIPKSGLFKAEINKDYQTTVAGVDGISAETRGFVDPVGAHTKKKDSNEALL